MSAQTEQQSNPFDTIKWILAIAFLAAAVVGNYYYGELSVVIRAASVVILVAIGLGIASQTTKGRDFLDFAKDSRIEVRKVVWPSRKEATNTTVIVLIATVIVALLLWGLDGILVRVVGLATGIGM